MNKKLCIAVFAVGALTVAWVASGYIGNHPLALVMTLIVGAVYGLGAWEMQRFHQATRSLAQALDAIPHTLTALEDWLGRIHPSLQNAVRLRVEGERIGLPGPALTPYLVGLLVMLGMLGTFLGMLVTLNGAVFALEGSGDLKTMRTALSAPIRGLGLAFGTSVAGVASSAMLGLISALCRRERQAVAQRLDAAIATELRDFSLVHQRQETFKAIQSQAQALPAVVDALQALMTQMERQHQQLNERLVTGQESFHREVGSVYGELARSVDQSLKTSLSASAQAAGETIKPLVEATLHGLGREAGALQHGMAAAVATQLDGLSARFASTVAALEASLAAALARQEHSSETQAATLQRALDGFTDTFAQRSATLVSAVQTDLAQRDQQRQAAMAESLQAMAESLRQEWQRVGAQSLAQQQQICASLERTAGDISAQAQRHASETIGEIGRLMESAAEAPRVAAEVIGQLRQELSSSLARDQDMLAERQRIMTALTGLLDAMQAGADGQRAAVDTLVTSAAGMLERVGSEFTRQVGADAARITDTAAQVAGSAVEVSSLSEAFGYAVQQFSAANENMIGNLQRIEAALDKSLARSDEQLAYYVAQAREIIDLSIMSQSRMLDDMQRLAGKSIAAADETA